MLEGTEEKRRLSWSRKYQGSVPQKRMKSGKTVGSVKMGTFLGEVATEFLTVYQDLGE